METLELKTKIVRLHEEELDAKQQKALAQAKAATLRSYSPYSHFRVGASVVLDNGEVVSGSNQENCAYPSGLCAERTAVFYANSRYPDKRILLICIAASSEDGTFTKIPISPCGACRQVMGEFHINRIIMANLKGDVKVVTLEEVLPFAFTEKDL